jgi:uncharacterized surface protein with fasciclin (FAS1) repeats
LVATARAGQLTIWQTVAANPDFSLLAKFLTQANLVAALDAPSAGLTVFAPTNEAFSQLNSQITAYLANPAHAAQLSSVLLSHVRAKAAKAFSPQQLNFFSRLCKALSILPN